MPLTTLKASAKKLGGGLAVESEARGFKMILDEPEEFGGTDRGMNPIEAMLCALGSCEAIVAYMIAGSMGIDLQDFQVEVEGDIDLEGLGGNPDVRPGLQEVRYKWHIKTDAPEEKVKELTETIEKVCPARDSLANNVKTVLSGVIIE